MLIEYGLITSSIELIIYAYIFDIELVIKYRSAYNNNSCNNNNEDKIFHIYAI